MKLSKRIIYILMSLCLVYNSIPSEVLGVIPHIISGSLFAFLTIPHIMLSRKFFIQCTKNFLKIGIKAKINLTIDYVLIILAATLTTTGVMLALDNIPSSFDERHDFEIFHGLSAAFMFILVIIHACLHIKRKKKN